MYKIYIYIFVFAYVYSRHQSQSPIHFCGSAHFFFPTARSFEYGGFAGKDLPAAGGSTQNGRDFVLSFLGFFFTTKGRNRTFEKGSRKKLSRFKPGCRVLPEFMKFWIFPLEKSVMSTVHIRTCINHGPDSLRKTIFVHWGTRCCSKTWWAHLCLDNDILCCRLQAQTRHPPGLSLQAVILMDESKNREVFQLIGLLKAKTWKRKVMPDIGFLRFIDCSWLFWFRSRHFFSWGNKLK